MNRIGQEIVKEWKELLARKLKKPVEEIDANGLSSADFGSNMKVVLSNPGELECTFIHAFSLVDEKASKVAVFTEHSGYHVFHLSGMKVSDIITEEYWDEDYSN